MRRLLLSSMMTACVGLTAFAQKDIGSMVLVEGGPFRNTNSTYYGKGITVPSFYIGKYEVTQKEWVEIMGTNPSRFKGDDLPVEMVTWYECIEYCNKRSIKEGLEPYYNIDKATKDPNNTNDADEIKWTVTINPGANGYRLPTEVEWEYAASGGQLSKNYVYSGSDELDTVGWYYANSGDESLKNVPWFWPRIERNRCRTRPVGSKAPNELGLYDMSGNVREFCWDWYADPAAAGKESLHGLTGPAKGALRVWKGGGWMGVDFPCEIRFRGGYEPFFRAPDQGFRVCRNK